MSYLHIVTVNISFVLIETVDKVQEYLVLAAKSDRNIPSLSLYTCNKRIEAFKCKQSYRENNINNIYCLRTGAGELQKGEI